MQKSLTTFTDAHRSALVQHSHPHHGWALANRPLTDAERELHDAGLLDLDGWRVRTSIAGLSLLVAVGS